jgi:hypothetical protein
MHLYNKKVNEITWDDVETFCNQRIAENAYLDYKEDFPGHLDRTIAAMANTMGGVILIGVAEDGQGKPVVPAKGIQMVRGLEDRVMNTILGNIAPPLFPEIAVCPNSTGDKATLVIRVHPSEQTPHVTHDNTRVYIRTGNRNNPEEIANIDRVEWLKNKRQKSVELRECISLRASTRFRSLRDGVIPGITATDEGIWAGDQEQPGLFTLALCPLYPAPKPLTTPPELDQIRRKITVKDYVRTAVEFPIQECGAVNRLVEDGLIMHYAGRQGLRTYHTHLNVHGLYLFKQSLLYKPRDAEKAELVIRGYEVLSRTYEMLESAEKFYGLIGYAGPLYFYAQLESLLRLPLKTVEFDGDTIVNQTRYSTDPNINISQVIATYDLSDRRQQAILYFAEHLGWTFDWRITQQFIDKFYRHIQSHVRG